MSSHGVPLPLGLSVGPLLHDHYSFHRYYARLRHPLCDFCSLDISFLLANTLLLEHIKDFPSSVAYLYKLADAHDPGDWQWSSQLASHHLLLTTQPTVSALSIMYFRGFTPSHLYFGSSVSLSTLRPCRYLQTRKTRYMVRLVPLHGRTFTHKIDAAYLGTLAALQIAQIGYLSQDLFENVKNANNLIARSKYELDRIHQTTIALLNVYEELQKDADYGQQSQ